MKAIIKSVVFLAVLFSLPTANAAEITWATFTGWNQGNQLVSGSIGSVGVTMQGNGDQFDVQMGGHAFNGNTFYSDIWTPDSTYSSSFGHGPYYNPNPGNSDIIKLNNAGTETITFSHPVTNPLIALMSWNGSVVSFANDRGVGYSNDPITILNTGGANAHWGSGSIALAGTGFNGTVGESNGLIEVLGTYRTITFTDATGEYWHGFTVGVPTPIPAALFFVAPALAGVFGFLRRKAG